MAPDKIFLPRNIDWPSAAILTLGNQPNDVEYIRKDALLEWAKARKAELLSCESFVAGERKMLKEIIDKLNSM